MFERLERRIYIFLDPLQCLCPMMNGKQCMVESSKSPIEAMENRSHSSRKRLQLLLILFEERQLGQSLVSSIWQGVHVGLRALYDVCLGGNYEEQWLV